MKTPFASAMDQGLEPFAPSAPVITAPADGALLALSNVTVEGTADAGAEVTVSFSSGGTGTDIADAFGVFQVGRMLVDGVHTVTAIARDGLGGVSPQSAPVTFTTDTRAPSRPQIQVPTSGSSTNNATVTIRGTAEAASTIQVFEGSQIASTTTAGNGVWTTSAVFGAGSHAISARARDAAGNTSTASLTTTFTVDLTAPGAPVISSPAAGAVLAPSQTVVSGSSEAGATILLYRYGSVVATTIAAFDGSWSQRLTVGAGDVGVRAQARDIAGNISPLSDERVFTVDATPPSVRFTTPDGTVITQLDQTRVRGVADDDHGVRTITLDFYDIAGRGVASSQTICTGCPGTPTSWEASTTPLVGRYVVRAYATDIVGNRSLEASITVTFVRITP